MNELEAKNIALAKLAEYQEFETTITFVLVESETIEKEWGWIFVYQSKEYLDTNEIQYALAGNAPFIVNRHTGKLSVTGTAQPLDYYIAEYEKNL